MALVLFWSARPGTAHRHASVVAAASASRRLHSPEPFVWIFIIRSRVLPVLSPNELCSTLNLSRISKPADRDLGLV